RVLECAEGPRIHGIHAEDPAPGGRSVRRAHGPWVRGYHYGEEDRLWSSHPFVPSSPAAPRASVAPLRRGSAPPAPASRRSILPPRPAPASPKPSATPRPSRRPP